MKNNLLNKSLLMSILFSSLVSTFSLQSTNRDIDIMKAKKPELRVLGSELRDQNYRLREENKRLEATIEPRSYEKGKNEGFIVDGLIGTGIGGCIAALIVYHMGLKNGLFKRK